jgi:hypothetical protein
MGREYEPKIRMSVDLTVAQFEALKAVAQHLGVSHPTVIRLAVEDFHRSYMARIGQPMGATGGVDHGT